MIKNILPNKFYPRNGIKPCLIVTHIAEASYEQTLATFKNENKSAHYFVKIDGEAVQFCEEGNAAWTQGVVKNPTSTVAINFIKNNPDVNFNLACISIEHEGINDINETMYATTAQLVYDIAKRHTIQIDRNHIIGHREIRSDKLCPANIDVDKIVRMAQAREYIQNDNVPSWFMSFITKLINFLMSFITK